MQLTLDSALAIAVPHQIISSWYNALSHVGCYIS